MTMNRKDAGYKVWEVDLLLEQIKSLEAKNTDLLKEWCIQAVACQKVEKDYESMYVKRNEEVDKVFWLQRENVKLKEQLGESR